MAEQISPLRMTVEFQLVELIGGQNEADFK